MDTTIEREFFKAFEVGGVVSDCISWMFYSYNLPESQSIYDNKGEKKEINEKEINEYEALFQNHNKDFCIKFTKEYDEDIIFDEYSPLIDEISTNLRELKDDEAERNSYLYSILKHFTSHRYAIAKIFVPKNRMTEMLQIIKKLEELCQHPEIYEEDDDYEEAKNIYLGIIENCKKEMSRVEEVNKRIRKILPLPKTDLKFLFLDSVEECLSFWLETYEEFVARLYYLTLLYNIDLAELQETSGMYITEFTPIDRLIKFFGSQKLALYYIRRLPKPQPQTTEKQPCNNRETTDNKSKITKEERKWYSIAIANGMAEETESGYRWLYNSGSKASLSYFIYKVFGNNTIEFNRLGELWGVGRFDTNLTNVLNAQKPQRWRGQIDALFSD